MFRKSASNNKNYHGCGNVEPQNYHVPPEILNDSGYGSIISEDNISVVSSDTLLNHTDSDSDESYEKHFPFASSRINSLVDLSKENCHFEPPKTCDEISPNSAFDLQPSNESDKENSESDDNQPEEEETSTSEDSGSDLSDTENQETDDTQSEKKEETSQAGYSESDVSDTINQESNDTKSDEEETTQSGCSESDVSDAEDTESDEPEDYNNDARNERDATFEELKQILDNNDLYSYHPHTLNLMIDKLSAEQKQTYYKMRSETFNKFMVQQENSQEEEEHEQVVWEIGGITNNKEDSNESSDESSDNDSISTLLKQIDISQQPESPVQDLPRHGGLSRRIEYIQFKGK